MDDDLTPYPLHRTLPMNATQIAEVYPTKTMFTDLDLADKNRAKKEEGGYRRRRVSRRRVSRRRVSRRRGSRRHRR